MPIKFDLQQFYAKDRIFIETGTYIGDGVKTALRSGFEYIYSIELDTDRYNKCKQMFEKYNRF